jgi:hypothetical protein
MDRPVGGVGSVKQARYLYLLKLIVGGDVDAHGSGSRDPRPADRGGFGHVSAGDALRERLPARSQGEE